MQLRHFLVSNAAAESVQTAVCVVDVQRKAKPLFPMKKKVHKTVINGQNRDLLLK